MKSLKKKGIASWAHLRFSIIGGLLANPPDTGTLHQELEKLAQKEYLHPVKDLPVTFGVSTIERWYYKALKSNDPVSALQRKMRGDSGSAKAMSLLLLEELKKQYRIYPHWSYQLHADNLKALTFEQPQYGKAPSYSTVLRGMQKRGWTKRYSGPRNKTPGQIKALDRLEKREVRGFESFYVHSLWHLDFHSSKRVVDVHGVWQTPKALCILDDRSRLCCHIQWYLDETAETLIHGLTQAFHKRGLPRSLMTDNGAAMLANETRNGLMELGITHEKTLPYSPYQNGKQESFWGQLEGRLLAMLSKVEPLTLEFLNRTTQAWIEQEYNRSIHAETHQTPLMRMLQGPDVSRPSVEGKRLNFYFTVSETRTQRASDGTLQVKGVRFEVPSRFRHLKYLTVNYKPFDLSMIYLVDFKTGDKLGSIYPQDKHKNARGIRRTLEPVSGHESESETNTSCDTQTIPPLLRKIMSDYAATGLPPAYLSKGEKTSLKKLDEIF